MIIRPKQNSSSYPDLSEDQVYFVIGIEADDLRILDDAGRPCLYTPGIFTVVDPREPQDWITEFGEDGERYAYPPQLNQAGFFEDFFDRKPEQTSIFWHIVNQRLSHAA